MIESALVVLIPSVLAYANGANDVSKGVATLVGSGVTSYRRAILWGTACTALGAVAASVSAGAMMATFGSGLLAAGIAPSFPAAIGALAGAALWVLIATRASLPSRRLMRLWAPSAARRRSRTGSGEFRGTSWGGRC